MDLSKYLTVFQISWQNEFIYRVNFVLWRVRNILKLLMTYFLWTGVYTANRSVFGYSKPEILTYIFMVLIVQTLVLSAPSADNIGSEIGSGDLSNYLLKPISYLKYWLTRDLASKLLNIIFATFEVSILMVIFQPLIKLPTHLASSIGFAISCIVASLIYFLLSACSRFISFWAPEDTWGFAFLLIILIEILAGGIFPLDILPPLVRTVLEFTPFPYLLYYPVSIYLGKISGLEMAQILAQSLVWLILLFYLCKLVWQKGLLTYSSEGR